MQTVGIISALDVEIDELRKKFSKVEYQTIAKHEFGISTFQEMKIITVVSGVGKVNAAITTQLLIDHFQPAYIINTGIAGGLDKSLKHHDIILGKDFTYHDFSRDILINFFPFVEKFTSDEYLLEISRKVLLENKISFQEGLIVSGDQFISSTEQSKALFEKYQALCVEMESCAIAHCCFSNDVKFVIIRALSDFADDEAESEYENNEQFAANCASEIVYQMLKEI